MSVPPARPDRPITAGQVLVAVVLLAVLFFMLFPWVPGPTGNSKRSKAKQDTLAIVHSVEGYVSEYGQLPNPDGNAASSGDAAVGDPAAGMRLDNARLFNVLRDIDRPPNASHTQNPKHQVFFTSNAVSNPRTPREGFLEVASSGGVEGAFYDPWGSQYNIVLDSDSGNTIDLANFYSDFIGNDSPRVVVGAFSLGKDRKLGTGGDRKYKDDTAKSDDLVSWAN